MESDLEKLTSKAYVGDYKNKFSKEVTSSGIEPVGLELGTTSIPVRCSPVWANVARASWQISNLTSFSPPIDFWTVMIFIIKNIR